MHQANKPGSFSLFLHWRWSQRGSASALSWPLSGSTDKTHTSGSLLSTTRAKTFHNDLRLKLQTVGSVLFYQYQLHSQLNYICSSGSQFAAMLHTNTHHTLQQGIIGPSAEAIDEAQAAVALSCADPSETQAASALSDVELVEVVIGPPSAIVQQRSKISEMSSKLEKCFLHLMQPQHDDVVGLIESYVSLFLDVPTLTHVLQQDMDVGETRLLSSSPS